LRGNRQIIYKRNLEEHLMNNYRLSAISPTPGPLAADDITRGVCRHLRDLGYSPLTEFKLRTNRRVDVIGLDKGGRFLVAEVKSSVADFRADEKWPEYHPYTDHLYFAVANGFPVELLPADCGIMIADAYNAVIYRQAPLKKLNAARRRAQTLRFAKTAADRLDRVKDPRL
jgi:hypothetical protein|tara:strand:+ start:144 stop:656 length:513 start_codon:yes stop_codon:yes gene_type:complete